MSKPEVVVIDYGVGNLLSVQRGFEYCGASVTLSSDPTQILAGQRVALPGVGAFRNAMQALDELNLVQVVREVALRGTPLLGICLGMQLLLDQSEEFGITQGLGILPGQVRPVPSLSATDEQLKRPHIGWNKLLPVSDDDWQGTLLADNDPGDSMYFVHSFMVTPANSVKQLAYCLYGGHLIPAVINRDNITGCQFHPEKSGELGLKIMKRFCRD